MGVSGYLADIGRSHNNSCEKMSCDALNREKGGHGMDTDRSTRVAAQDEPRVLDDPKAMRALAHPVRIALLEALTREGPLTATEAGGLLGESAGTMSFHLRTLARYGFVEETGTGKGRARPWRLVRLGTTYADNDPDPERSVAAARLSAAHLDRSYAKLRAWLEGAGAAVGGPDGAEGPDPWRDVLAAELIAYLTADELAALRDEVLAVLLRHRDRTLDRSRRPAGARPVQLVAYGVPLPLSPTGN